LLCIAALIFDTPCAVLCQGGGTAEGAARSAVWAVDALLQKWEKADREGSIRAGKRTKDKAA
jgi:hypothetical protein